MKKTEAYPMWFYDCPHCGESCEDGISDGDFVRTSAGEYQAEASCDKCDKEFLVTRD